MNARSYKTVFSKRLGALVAVGEHASSQGKANGAGSGGGAGASGTLGYIAALTASFALVSLAWATPATNALPTAGQVVRGAASMSQTASQMTIHQGTQRAAINWQSFDIGAAARVQVNQPNAQAVLLNRVVGQSPSQIFGQLQANGHVILVNPNGVLFGKDGSVNAASFTASTLGISDANFMAGNMVYERNGSTAGIVNEGSITTAPGGYVALLGASVSNQGQINTQGGNAFLGAADTIKVPVSSTGRIKLELTAADMNANVSNTGSIITQGGQVYMQALALNQAAAQIIQSGSIDTSGVQGGAVNILADGGKIRVSGSVKANSTNGTAGGDVYIGRDKDTNVLAAVGDVRNATLESQGGFVETSGQYLATTGVSVKAKDWLLDPSDITISNSADNNISGTSPSDLVPSNSGSSNVQVGTIQTAINAGTNVTIKTTNSSSVNNTGAGNITIASPLNFKNISTNPATLSLIADNGIIQNAAITTDATSTGLVHISMEAKGNYQGFTPASPNSDGININAGISTNGNITLKGSTSKDGNEGVYIDRVTLRAQNIDITGTSTGAGVPGSIEHTKGIRSFGTLIATDKITLNGTSTNVTGVGLEGGSVTAGGAVLIEGKATSGIYQGTNIGANVTGGSVTITGETRDNLGVAIGANVTATNGNVVIDGTSVNSRGVGIANSRIVRSNSADVFITGKSVVSDGINVGNQGAAQIIAAKNITLDGKGASGGVRTWAASLLTAGTTGAGGVQGNITIKGDATTGSGVIFQQYVSSARLKASNNIDINGTVTGGAGSGSGVQTLTSETNGQSVMFNADGKFTMTATNSDSSNTSRAIDGQDGMQVTAVDDISIKAYRQTSIGNAIYFFSNTNGLGGNASFKSSNGDVLIQANQGGIIFENAMSPTYTTGTYTSLTDISGRNITIDNTGGGVSTVTGKFEAGTGTSTANGINLASTAGIKMIATQNINLSGNSTGAAGVLLGGPITVKAAGDVNIQGKTTSAGAVQGVFLSGTSSVEGKNVDIEGTAFNGNGVLSYADINATSGGSATITGTSTGTGGSASALSLWAKVTADQNVNLKGENTHTGNTPAAVFTNKAITATNGKIDVTAITKGTSFNALQLHDGGSLTAKTEINLKADTLSISNAATINAGAGTGKVTITTDSANANINIGAADVGSTTTSARTLGLTNAELNQISAGKTVIGDLANTGKITVGTNSETSSAASNGNVVLQTKGDIEIANKLTIASGKTLTLNAGGSVTDNDTNGIIKADKLELLGDGSFNLDNKKQNVGTLAANVKSLVFTNETALKVDTVNGTTGVTAKEGVRVTTEKGDLTINKAITNTASGNVVVGAGVSEAAGSTVQGDVKTTSGQAITTQAGGKTLVYTGSAAGSGLLSHLNTALGDLKVTGDATQNTDTNFAFNNGVGISGSTETAQVMFREKVTITNGLVGTTVGKTYGDAETKNDASAKAALLVETIAKLKQEGGNLGTLTGTSANYTTPTPTSGNVIKIAKSVIIDSLTGNLDGAGYSGAQYLKANGTYAYNTASNKLTSTKYTLVDSTFTDAVKVTVAQKALTGSIGDVVKTYGDALSFGTVSALAGKVTGDVVDPNGATVNLTPANTSSSGRLKVGSHTQTVSGLSGTDSANYSHTGVTGSYTVKPKELTIGVGTVKDKPADGTTSAVVTAGALVGVLGGENLGLSATGNFVDPNMGNGKVVNALYNLQNGVNGEASNYILNIGTPSNPDSRLRGNILASVNPVVNPTPSPVNNNGVSRVRTVSGFGGAGAATGVLDDQPANESREVCSDLYPENCECLPSVIPTIEICFAPKRVVANKEEK